MLYPGRRAVTEEGTAIDTVDGHIQGDGTPTDTYIESPAEVHSLAGEACAYHSSENKMYLYYEPQTERCGPRGRVCLLKGKSNDRVLFHSVPYSSNWNYRNLSWTTR